jgi:6-phospho-beta-glucosidase
MADGTGLKIAIIGGGSSYTPELVEGFLARQHELPLRELCFVDVEAGRQKQDIVVGLARRMAAKAGCPATISATLDRSAALDGADFVLTQLRVGQIPARILDERIPLDHGVIGQETTGPGGFMKALRSIPVLFGICDDVARLCPEAWILNFANPSGIVSEAVLRHKTRRFIGLCNNPINTTAWVAKTFNVAPHEAFVEFAGVNHVTWGRRAYVRGRDVTAEALAAMAGAHSLNAKNVPAMAWPKELLDAMDGIPSSYIKYYTMPDEMLADALAKHRAGKPCRAEEVAEVEAALFAKYADPALDRKPEELSKRGGALYSEAALRLVAAIHGDRHDIQCVNTLNRGALPDLADDVAVEVNCMIDARGATPLLVGRINPFIRGILQRVKCFEELTVAAAVSGDRRLALEALASNPLVPSIGVAQKLLDAMLEANRPYLPQFFRS